MRPSPVILVTGVNGQVGHALVSALSRLGTVVAADMTPPDGLACDFHPVDFLDLDTVRALIRATQPQIVVNPAAYTAVDKAEAEEDRALRINAEAPGVLATEAARLGAAFIHYSTDYVFDGSGSQPRREDAETAPLSAYGRTKLAGERAVLAAHPAALIFRTSWVFSDHGHNFVKTMLRLGSEREQLKIVSDQIGAPTSAAFLAAETVRVLEVLAHSGLTAPALGGVYHLCCAGETSWHGFAGEIFRLARANGLALAVRDVQQVPTSDYPTPAQRPLNSRLDCDKFARTFAAKLATWQECLAPVVASLVRSNS